MKRITGTAIIAALLVLRPGDQALPYEPFCPVETENRCRTSSFRAGFTGKSLMHIEDRETDDIYRGDWGVFADFTLYKKKCYYYRLFEIYTRLSCRRFSTDEDETGPDSWNGSLTLGGLDCGLRFTAGRCFEKKLICAYLLAAPRLVYGLEESEERDKKEKYLSWGITAGAGVEMTVLPQAGIFAEFSRGYVPLGEDKVNSEGNQIWFGISIRTR